MQIFKKKEKRHYTKEDRIKILKKMWGQKYLYLMFLIPFAVYFTFQYLPLTKVPWAFTNLGEVPKYKTSFVGLKHFKNLIGTSAFRRAFVNTLTISFYNLLTGSPSSVLIALCLNEISSKWFKKTTQTIIYLPHFFSWAIIGGIFYLLLAPQNSVNSQISGLLGKEATYYFASLKHIRGLLVFTNRWQGAGYGAIVYLAALAGVDPGLYEAATLDGANKFQKIKHISLPCIRPIITTMFILSIGGILNVFGQVVVLCTEITYAKVDTIDLYAYRTGIQQMKQGYATAVSLFKGVISMYLVWLTNRIVKKMSDGEEGVF